MAMDDLIGQLIWGFIGSGEGVEPAERAAREGRLSGVWLLRPEMRSPGETAKLVNRLQAASPVPLLVGVDAEAGLGLVMSGATELPTAMALGATGDPSFTAEAAALTAAEAGACGINAVGAPVLDVNINPANPIINTRSFGGTPELVGRHGVAFLEGTERGSSPDARVLPIGKHFPGHGDTRLDSHLQLDTVSQPRERLEAVELEPFRQAIAGGVPMLMTAHVVYPALDPDPGVPATLSRPILTDVLRGELGFEGVLVTDCMNMHAIARNFDGGDAAVRCVEAGCDLVLTDDLNGAHEALSQAFQTGRISEERIREAAGRVRRVKAQIFGEDLRRPAPISHEEAQANVGSAAHAEVAKRIAAASVTLVSGRLTTPSSRPLIMATRMDRWFGPTSEEQLRAVLASVGWEQAEVMMLDAALHGTQINAARKRAQAARWAALLHFNRVQSFDPAAVATGGGLVALADEVAAAGVPLTVVSLGSPYALPLFQNSVAKICTYSTCDASLQATLEVLMGSSPARGHMPVELDTPPGLQMVG